MSEVQLIVLGIGILGLFYLYGNIRFKEGRKNGYVVGSLKSTAQILSFLEEAKVIGLTQTGDIYRIDDNGNRDAIVFDAAATLRKIDGNLQGLLNTTQKDLDTR